MYGYNASKGAVSLLTKGMALDLGREGIRVNAVAPATANTRLAGMNRTPTSLIRRRPHCYRRDRSLFPFMDPAFPQVVNPARPCVTQHRGRDQKRRLHQPSPAFGKL